MNHYDRCSLKHGIKSEEEAIEYIKLHSDPPSLFQSYNIHERSKEMEDLILKAYDKKNKKKNI